MPPAGCLHWGGLVPSVGFHIVAGHGAGVGAVNVPTGHQDISGGQGGTGVAAAGHLHGCAHLPGIGGGQVTLGGGQETFHIAPADGQQAAPAGCQREMSAALTHTGQVEPGVEARVISRKRDFREPC